MDWTFCFVGQRAKLLSIREVGQQRSAGRIEVILALGGKDLGQLWTMSPEGSEHEHIFFVV
jgi:hypothetical protein